MAFFDASKRREDWALLLSRGEQEELFQLLKEAPVVEVADFLGVQEPPVCAKLLLLFPRQQQAELFSCPSITA